MWRDWLRKKNNPVLQSFWNVGMDDLDLDEFDDYIFYEDWVTVKIGRIEAILKKYFLIIPKLMQFSRDSGKLKDDVIHVYMRTNL